MIVNTQDRQTETVDTWANGFGVWHARVNFIEPGYGPQYLDSHIDRIRAKARRAIRRELLSRGAISRDWRVAVEVESSDLDSMNVMHSITYVEKGYAL